MTVPAGSGLLVNDEDLGGPGAGANRFWIQVRDKNGDPVALFLDDPATANGVTLEGGNIVVPQGEVVGATPDAPSRVSH